MENQTNPVQAKAESLTPRELFNKHLSDPEHKVTDEDLKNLKVGTDAEDESEVKKETDAKADEVENLPDNDTLPNPYSVLG